MIKKLIFFFSGLLDPPFSPGMLINDRYQVILHLGSGGFGHSYLVVDQHTNCRIVLKALRLHRRVTSSGRKAFEYEKELLKSITHPGFPKYLHTGKFKRIPFYTMEFVDGKNFEQLIFDEQKRYSELEAFKIANKLLSLIEYLHSKEIIHRDIRIPNVIANDKNLWLIDLGLAIEKCGAPNKMGKNNSSRKKQMNNRADFYLLGHFLLFLLYSNFAFAEGSKERSWEQELNISQQSRHIIRKLLETEAPYQNCAEIQNDIEKFIFKREQNIVF